MATMVAGASRTAPEADAVVQQVCAVHCSVSADAGAVPPPAPADVSCLTGDSSSRLLTDAGRSPARRSSTPAAAGRRGGECDDVEGTNNKAIALADASTDALMGGTAVNPRIGKLIGDGGESPGYVGPKRGQ